MNINDVVLQSERTILKPIAKSDLENIHRLHTLLDVTKFNTLDIPENIEDTLHLLDLWIEQNQKKNVQQYSFAVTLKGNSTFIGLMGINIGKPKYRNAEVWFKFDPKFWNKGYATETLKIILDFGFDDLKLHRIEAGCAVENIGSIKVLEKLGMQREAHTRQLLPLKSGWSDNYGYAILSTD